MFYATARVRLYRLSGRHLESRERDRARLLRAGQAINEHRDVRVVARGFFLMHRWDAVFGDPKTYAGPELPGGAIQKGMMFDGFDGTTGRFRTNFFDGNGPFQDGNMYEGEVVGGNLRFTGPARFTLIENEDGTISKDWELREDDGEWRPWRHTTMTRVGETDGAQT